MADFHSVHFAEHINKILRIQSVWRGVVTRKKLRETLEEYRAIQVELGDTNNNFPELKQNLWTKKSWCTSKQTSQTLKCPKISQNDESHHDTQESDNSLQSIEKELAGKHHLPGDGSQETKGGHNSKTCSSEHRRHSRSSSNTDDFRHTENYNSNKWTRDVHKKTEGQSNIASELDTQTEYFQPKDSGDFELTDVSDLEAKNDYPEKGKSKFCKELTAPEKNKEELENERSSTAMELLWVQQAIESRKQYLRLRTDISE